MLLEASRSSGYYPDGPHLLDPKNIDLSKYLKERMTEGVAKIDASMINLRNGVSRVSDLLLGQENADYNLKRVIEILGISAVIFLGSQFIFPEKNVDASNAFTVCPTGCDFSDIQSAVDAASDSDVIKVAAGSYPDINSKGGENQVIYINKNVTVRGGYGMLFNEPPDPNLNPVIINPGCSGRGITIFDASPSIEGLKVTGGCATNGGGIQSTNSSPRLKSNTIEGNTATGMGGGIYVTQFKSGQTAEFNRNLIRGNNSQSGGGIAIDRNSGIWQNNVVRDNTATLQASGVYINTASPIFVNTTIAKNTGLQSDGIAATSGTSVQLWNTIIADQTIGVWTAGSVQMTDTLMWKVTGNSGSITFSGNQINADPYFAADGYHIQTQSAAKEMGHAAGYADSYFDIDGDPRCISKWDLGADQRSTCTVPVPTDTPTLTPTDIPTKTPAGIPPTSTPTPTGTPPAKLYLPIILK